MLGSVFDISSRIKSISELLRAEHAKEAFLNPDADCKLMFIVLSSSLLSLADFVSLFLTLVLRDAY